MKRKPDVMDRIVRAELWTSIWQGARLVLSAALLILGVIDLVRGDVQEATFAVVLVLLLMSRR